MKKVAAAIALSVAGFLLAVTSSNSRAWTCDDKPNHPKCQTTGTTTTTPPPTTPPDPGNNDDVAYPIRAAFTYHWYPENWNDCTALVCGSWHEPDPLWGRYGFSYDKVRYDIDGLQRANIKVGIDSWHGPGSNTDKRLPTLLQAAKDDGQSFQWTVYYEREGQVINGINQDPTAAQIKADLDYLKANYVNHANWLWKEGKPVIFVYTNADNGTCDIVNRWRTATNNWQDWFVSPQVFPNYTSCTGGPQVWHQYSVENGLINDTWDSTTIGPEVWLMHESSPRVVRSMTRWCDHIRKMVSYGDKWQLIISADEWGEATSIMPGVHRTQGNWGYTYIDALARNGANC